MKRAWLLGLALLIAACSGTATPGPSAESSPGAVPRTPVPSLAAPVSVAPNANGSIAVDEGLLRYLPNSVGGITVVYSGEATQEVRGDAALARNASAIAYGMAIDPQTGDLVVAAVVRLRPGVFNGVFFLTWRTTYDRAACAQANGVGGLAETTINGRVVHIGTCKAGAHTYHVYLDQPGVVISATSIGVKRFGEQLVEGLRL